MDLQLKHKLLLCTSLILILGVLQLKAEESTAAAPDNSNDEDNSSSEETVEASNESAKRRKRSLEVDEYQSNEKAKPNNLSPRAGIPGIPNPQTIIKIAEILQTVGEKVVPILIEGITTNELINERISKDFEFLKNFQRELHLFSTEIN